MAQEQQICSMRHLEPGTLVMGFPSSSSVALRRLMVGVESGTFLDCILEFDIN